MWVVSFQPKRLIPFFRAVLLLLLISGSTVAAENDDLKCFERYVGVTLEVDFNKPALRLINKVEGSGRICRYLRKDLATLVYRVLDERGQTLFEAQEYVAFGMFYDIDPAGKSAGFFIPEKSSFNLFFPIFEGRAAKSLEVHFLQPAKILKKRVLAVKL